MEIKNKPTLAEKQAFWAEQLPNFEAKYWLPSHFELLEFDMEGGNYEVRDVLPEHYSEDDASDIYHRVNTGWAMWKKAINFTKAQAVPEGFVLVPERNVHDHYIANHLKGTTCSVDVSELTGNDGDRIYGKLRPFDCLGSDGNTLIYDLESSNFNLVKTTGNTGDFILVPKEPTDKTIAHMTNTPVEVNLLCDHADTFLSEGEACIAYQAMIEAQEQSHD